MAGDGAGDTHPQPVSYTHLDVYKRQAYELIESGKVSYVVYTGALRDDTMREYIALHRRALAKSIACLTSLDTANALADILKSRYNERNTELVDLCHMRARRSELRFAKMQCAGTDYIVTVSYTHLDVYKRQP